MKITNSLSYEAVKEVYLYTFSTDTLFHTKYASSNKKRTLWLLLSMVLIFLAGKSLIAIMVMLYAIGMFFFYPLRVKKQLENTFDSIAKETNQSTAEQVVEIIDTSLTVRKSASVVTLDIQDITEIVELRLSYLIRFTMSEEIILSKTSDSVAFVSELVKSIANSPAKCKDETHWKWRIHYWA